jgi:tetratricopeptide (TPR) repeat protein
MTFLFVLLVLAGAPLVAEGAQTGRATGAQAVQPPADRVAEAYTQFLLARRYEDEDDIDAAITAYKRAIALDPKAASIVAELADLYMRNNRVKEAMTAAEQGLVIAPNNVEAHRVLGTIYATAATSPRASGSPETQKENLARAIQHLEQALVGAAGGGDANLRAMLARLYITNDDPAKAIPILSLLVREEPGWQDGPTLLMEAYRSSGRTEDAVKWLEEAVADQPQLYSTLGDFYGQEQRYKEAANAYEQAMKNAPRSFDLRMRYASMLLSAGNVADYGKARDALREALQLRGTDERALYMLSQAERGTGELDAAEATARRLIAQNSANPRGYSALADALEERQRYQPLVDTLAPAMATFRAASDGVMALATLLPRLGFAYERLGQYDKAIATFEEARKASPRDLSIAGYLIQAHMSAKQYQPAVDLARSLRAQYPDNLGLARLEAQALRQSGKTDEGIALLEGLLKKREDDPEAYSLLAEQYADSNKGAQAIKLLQDAQLKFPDEPALTFELAAIFEKQKKYSEAEAAFRQVLSRDPEHARALNYLGYMFADQGVHLDESVDLIKRALKLEPDNGSYLDSLGWAYYKGGKFDLAVEPLKRAADQLPTNSVVQDHYGDLLVRLQRFDEAIAAWTRALAGDGDEIDRGDIDRKIRSARQKLPKR